MRKIFILAKTLLKGGGTFSAKKKSRSKFLFPAILLFALVSFGFSIIMLTLELYDVMAVFDIQHMIVTFAFGATSVVVFMFGIFYVVSTMYHAKDISMLRSLPLKPYQILGGKFLTLIVYEYIMEAYILLPILIGFGIKSGGGVLYIAYSLILLLVTPVIGLTIASVLVMIVMRFTSFGKNKQVFNFVGSFLIIGLAIGLNVSMQSLGKISEAQLTALSSGQSSMVNVVGNIFPGVKFAAISLVHSNDITGFFNFVLFLVCCAAAIAIFLGIGQLVYFQGVSGITESAAKRKGVSDISKKTQRSSAIVAYLKKEFRLLIRSPIGFMNCVLVNLIWPVIIIIMLFSGGQIQQLQSTLQSMDTKLVIALLVAASAVMTSTNATASTTISREGKELYVSKYIPLQIENQLIAKIITAFVLSAFGIIIICILAVVLGFGFGSTAIAFLLSLLVAAVLSASGVLIDIAHPKLNWMNEQQAIKQNINVLLHMIVGIVVAAVLVLPVLFLPMTLIIAVIYMCAVLGILLMLLLRRVRKGASKTLAEMDV